MVQLFSCLGSAPNVIARARQPSPLTGYLDAPHGRRVADATAGAAEQARPCGACVRHRPPCQVPDLRRAPGGSVPGGVLDRRSGLLDVAFGLAGSSFGAQAPAVGKAPGHPLGAALERFCLPPLSVSA